MTPLRRRLVLLLLPALVLAQWLGLAHGVAHARLSAPAALAAAPSAASQPQAAASSVFDALFAGHDSLSCRVLDQLGHAGALPCVPLQPAPAMLPAFLPPVVTGRLLATLAAAFQARAPPALR